MYQPEQPSLDVAKQQAVLQYFRQLRTRDLSDFAENWDALPHCNNFQQRQLAAVILAVAKEIPKHHFATNTEKAAALTHAKQNFDLWENQALKIIKAFGPRSTSTCIRAIATLKAKPCEEFLEGIKKAKPLTNAQNINPLIMHG